MINEPQDKQEILKMQYWEEQRIFLEFKTAWCMSEWNSISQDIFVPSTKVVRYEFVTDSGQTIQVTATALSGSVHNLWAAAEHCYHQASQHNVWHSCIQDFVLQDDGSFKLIMES